MRVIWEILASKVTLESQMQAAFYAKQGPAREVLQVGEQPTGAQCLGAAAVVDFVFADFIQSVPDPRTRGANRRRPASRRPDCQVLARKLTAGNS